MKKTIVFGILFANLFFGFANNIIDSMNHLLQEGNTFYQEKKYDEAINCYLQIVENNYESAVLFYNIGNAYYKNENRPKALLWYERALRLSPANDDIKHNIAFVNQKLTDRIEKMPELFIMRWWNKISSSLTGDNWGIVGIACSVLLMLSLLGLLFIRRPFFRSSFFLLSFAVLIVGVFAIFFAQKEINRYQEQPEAIIMKTVINAKSAPNNSGSDLFVIHEGLKVKITDQLNEWVEIKIPNGEKGWVKAYDLEVI